MIEAEDVKSLTTTPDAEPPKKPYTAPRMIVHGTVVQITAKIGTQPDIGAIGGSFVGQTN